MAEQEPWKQLYHYWLSKHVGGRPPGRADIDPVVEVPRLTANIMLIDAEGGRFRYRLVGSALWGRFKLELTGRWVENGSPAEAAWRDTLRAVRDDHVPRLITSPVADHADQRHIAVAMPLLGAADAVSQILAGTFFARETGDECRIGELSVRQILDGW
jgi:hypothetical protein